MSYRNEPIEVELQRLTERVEKLEAPPSRWPRFVGPALFVLWLLGLVLGVWRSSGATPSKPELTDWQRDARVCRGAGARLVAREEGGLFHKARTLLCERGDSLLVIEYDGEGHVRAEWDR